MARIKVTGYLNTEDLNPEEVDLNHGTGLSAEGYDKYRDMLELEDLDFDLEK